MGKELKKRSREIWHHLRNTFLTGLVALLPVFITIYIVIWLISTVDFILKRILPKEYEIPGIGILMAVALVMLIGFGAKVWFGRRVLVIADIVLARIPVVRAIYGSARDLIDLFTKTKAQEFNQVVMMDLPGMGFKMLGFVTRTDLADLPPEVAENDRVAVYLPLAYQMGGLVVLVDKANLRPVDMSLQSAIRFVVTAGVSKETREQTNNDMGRTSQL